MHVFYKIRKSSNELIDMQVVKLKLKFWMTQIQDLHGFSIRQSKISTFNG